MDKRNIATLADEVRTALGHHEAPIDPFVIANEEGILLKPGNYAGVDGCIEFLSSHGVFVLYYEDGAVSDGRTRFTVAHELGHYFIPEHVSAVMKSKIHGSRTGFVSEKVIEEEADEFASALLMPTHLFEKKLKDISVRHLKILADTFKTSFTSTARKMIDLTRMPSSVVFSKQGKVWYARHSEDMRYKGLTGINRGDVVPSTSQTAHVAATGSPDKAKAEIWAAEWYKNERQRNGSRKVWEEVMSLGAYGFLTFLVYDP